MSKKQVSRYVDERTNVRLISVRKRAHQIEREIGGEYVVQPDVPTDMLRVIRDLKAYQAAEPDADWHLEYRGTETTWHRENNAAIALAKGETE